MQVLTYTDYALRVLIYVGTHSEAPAPASAIARAYQISPDHVAKAAKALTRSGVLRAARGAGGGLTLARPAAEIRIGEIVRAFERGRGPVECFREGAPTCQIVSGCRLRGVFARAAEAFYEELDRHTLADLLAARAPLVRLLPGPAAAGTRGRPRAATRETRLAALSPRRA